MFFYYFQRNALIKLKNLDLQINERFSLLCSAWDNAYNLVNLEAEEADKIMNFVVCHTLEFMLMVN